MVQIPLALVQSYQCLLLHSVKLTRSNTLNLYTKTLHMEKRNIRVMIADDHVLYRNGLRSLLTQIRNIEVVGEASNGQELVRRSIELTPDVILTDIGMPVMDGVLATKEIGRRKLG